MALDRQETETRPIILVDSYNVFTRHYCANPAMSATGEPMGGVVGFMNAIKNLVEKLRPACVIIAWEGGGSLRRRQLFPEYKAHRRPVRLNRFYGDDIPNTVENRDDQVRALVKCLKHVPVCQVYVGECEADDVIAYICRAHFNDRPKVIMSSDKDYYQLLDEHTRIFRPGKKIFVTKDDVVDEFGISPRNFSLAKALCGDGSDNIPGVKGVGFKTLAKRFPALASDEEFDLDLMMIECRKQAETSKVKAFQAIVDAEVATRRNLRLIELDGSMLAPEQTRKVDYALDTFEPTKDKIGLIRELIALGLGDFNVDTFFYTMMSI